MKVRGVRPVEPETRIYLPCGSGTLDLNINGMVFHIHAHPLLLYLKVD